MKVGEELHAVEAGHESVGHNDIGHEALAELSHGVEAVFGTRYLELFGKKCADHLAQAVMGWIFLNRSTMARFAVGSK